MAGSRFEDFLSFAIDKEIEAAELYERHAALVQSASSRKLLADMELMERGHEKKLRDFMKSGAAYFSRIGVIDDMQVSDFMAQPELNENSSIEDVFVFAMKEEQRAFELYVKLGALEPEGPARLLFRSLADDEKKHKRDLEIEYEKNFIREN